MEMDIPTSLTMEWKSALESSQEELRTMTSYLRETEFVDFVKRTMNFDLLNFASKIQEEDDSSVSSPTCKYTTSFAHFRAMCWTRQMHEFWTHVKEQYMESEARRWTSEPEDSNGASSYVDDLAACKKCMWNGYCPLPRKDGEDHCHRRRHLSRRVNTDLKEELKCPALKDRQEEKTVASRIQEDLLWTAIDAELKQLDNKDHNPADNIKEKTPPQPPKDDRLQDAPQHQQEEESRHPSPPKQPTVPGPVLLDTTKANSFRSKPSISGRESDDSDEGSVNRLNNSVRKARRAVTAQEDRSRPVLVLTPPASDEVPTKTSLIESEDTPGEVYTCVEDEVRQDVAVCEEFLNAKLNCLTDHSYYQNRPHNMDCLGIQTPSESESQIVLSTTVETLRDTETDATLSYLLDLDIFK
ncbi:hypothetical protein EAI_10153 [Harpegnathos saltator]|uniref:Uncharacterized protein n=1 Tax=Harpegnathos saltator TaxID=610380 RepID=E2B544_HARSA|nr:hypothetical protein EAI_10153 [Harpegnathos saltator]